MAIKQKEIKQLKGRRKMSVEKRSIKTVGRQKKEIGALGEGLVVKHLKNKGFTHIESNYLKRQGELDLVMEFKGIIHFFEVKTVSREIESQNRANNGEDGAFGAISDVIRETDGKNLVNRETSSDGKPKDEALNPVEVIRETPNHTKVNRETKHNPEENVTLWKIRKISRVVQVYLSERGLVEKDWRFHVAVVYLDQKNKKALIKFIKDIPLEA